MLTTALARSMLFLALLAFSAFSAGNALLRKRDPRAAVGWIVLCMMLPGVGALAYWVLGVNRIRTRGRKLAWPIPIDVIEDPPEPGEEEPAAPLEPGVEPEALRTLARLGTKVARKPLLAGNAIDVLHDGEQAYPAMLEAIRGAERSVHLASYIFDRDRVGLEFVEALADAHRRGLDVRVLLDGMGEGGSPGRIRGVLEQRGLPTGRFLPPRLFPPAVYVNLRNHRKLLIVDGRIGFTGGMNVSARHLLQDTSNPERVSDIHFRVRGPVVSHLAQTFLEDWMFVTEQRATPRDLPSPEPAGRALARGIVDGPNEDMDRIKWILIGALSSAQHHVRLMTPYFLPDRELAVPIVGASLRGVPVDLILPLESDVRVVDWASRAMLWEFLMNGVRVYFQPPPFAHTKLTLIDGHYVQLGSANLDPRSLRLNFEFNLEVWDDDLARELGDHFEDVRRRSHRVTLEEMDSRSLKTRLLHATARLFSPYL